MDIDRQEARAVTVPDISFIICWSNKRGRQTKVAVGTSLVEMGRVVEVRGWSTGGEAAQQHKNLTKFRDINTWFSIATV